MRIAYVTETYPPELNGVSLTVERTVRHLRERGHELELVRPRQRGEAPRDAADARGAGTRNLRAIGVVRAASLALSGEHPRAGRAFAGADEANPCAGDLNGRPALSRLGGRRRAFECGEEVSAVHAHAKHGIVEGKASLERLGKDRPGHEVPTERRRADDGEIRARGTACSSRSQVSEG